MATERHTTTLDIKVDDREVARLGKEIERTFSTRSIEAFNTVIERQTKALETLIKQQEKLQKTFDGPAGPRGGGGGGGGGAGGAGGAGGQQGRPLNRIDQMVMTAIGTYLGQRFGGHGHGGHGGGTGGGHGHHGGFSGNIAAAAQGHLAPHLIQGLPGPVGTIGQGLVEGGMEMYEKAAAAAQARLGAFGRSGINAGQMNRLMGRFTPDGFQAGLGIQLGMSDEEMSQRMAGFAGQTGLRGRSLMGLAPTLLRAGRFAGIDSAGALIGGAGAAGGQGGGERGQKLIEDAIGSGLAAGIREGRLDQFIQSVGQFTEQMRNEGVLIKPESVTALTRGLGRAGLRGMEAAQFARGAMTGLKGALDQPSMMTGILMRSMGVGQEGGPSYTQARLDLENDPAAYLPNIVNTVRGMVQAREGQDPEEVQRRRGLLLEMVLKKAGIPVSRSQALRMVSGDPEALANLDADKGDAERRGRRYVGRQAAQAPDMKIAQFGALEEQKGKLIGGLDPHKGSDVLKMVQTVHEADMAALKTILPSLAGVVTGAVELAEAAVAAYQGRKTPFSRKMEKGLGMEEGTLEMGILHGTFDKEALRKSAQTLHNMQLTGGDLDKASEMTMRQEQYLQDRARKDKIINDSKSQIQQQTGVNVGANDSPLKAAARATSEAARYLQQAAEDEGYDMVFEPTEVAGGRD